MDLEKIVEKAIIKNILEQRKKADLNAVMKKIISENPELRKEVKKIIEIAKQKIEEYNNLPIEKIEKIAEELNIKIEEKSKEYEWPELEIKGKIITAFPPEPSKYPHIGHAKAAYVNYYYAKKYNGIFILRFEDSNPEKVKREYYNAFRNDLKWLEIDWQKEDILSLHLEEFYNAARELILKDKAYVCLCEKEKIREYRKEGKECEHRNLPIEKSLKLFEEMISGNLEEGKAIVRLKIDMKHKNYTMRDPAILRICFKPHPITGEKYKVWPLYDFGTALMDAWEKITHRFRSKEFEQRTELQNWIREALGYKEHPKIYTIGRLKIKGFLTSGRKIRELFEKGIIKDWDDIRLATLSALRKRGFLPKAILDFLYKSGLSKAEGILDSKILESINRQHLDAIANRYMFVENPKHLKIINAKPKYAKIKFHPNFPERGEREILVKNDVFISESDFNNLKIGDEIRLIDLYNIKIIDKNENSITAEKISEELIKDMKKIHWVSMHDDFLKVKVLKAEKEEIKEIKGYGESYLKYLNIGERIQFMRFGFVKLEEIKGKELTFIFIHE